MRTTEAEIEVGAVSLLLWKDVTLSVDVAIKDTSWESDDYFLVTVTDGVDTIELAREEGTLAGLPEYSWMRYQVDIPDDWKTATLSFSSSTNSSVDAEAIDFDNIEFRGLGLEFIPGDTNGDNVVDDLDYANLVAQFGGSPGAESADFNEDGIVDVEDFVVLRDYFGLSISAAPHADSGATTPEPATLTLLALGGLAVSRRRKK